MWSAQAVRDSKIDALNAIYTPCVEPEASNSSAGWHWNTHRAVLPTYQQESAVAFCTLYM